MRLIDLFLTIINIRNNNIVTIRDIFIFIDTACINWNIFADKSSYSFYHIAL